MLIAAAYIWKHVIGSFLLEHIQRGAHGMAALARGACSPQSEGSLCGLYPHAYVPLPRATMVYESYSLAAYLAADRSALPFLGAL